MQTSALDARFYPLCGETAAATDKPYTRTTIAAMKLWGILKVRKRAAVGGDVRHAADVVATKDDIGSCPVYRRPGSAFNFGCR